MLNATLSIELNTNSDAANAVRGALAATASELVVKYGLAGEVRLVVEAAPQLPDPEASDSLGLSRHIAVSGDDIRAILASAATTNGLGGEVRARIEIDYVDLHQNRTTRVIRPFRIHETSVKAYDEWREDDRTFLFSGITRAEAV